MAFHKRRLRNIKPRKLIARSGEKLQKHITLKVIIGDIVKTHVMRAPAGSGYSEEDVWEMRAHAIDRLDVKYPMFEFNEVEVGKDQFNYIMCGTRGVLHQPELFDEPNREPEPEEDTGGNYQRSLREQIADALAGDRDAIAGVGSEGRTAEGSAESVGGTAESTEGTAAEVDQRSTADGSDSPENL